MFCPENLDTFTRALVHVSKINAVDRAQLTFQILTLIKNIYIWNDDLDLDIINAHNPAQRHSIVWVNVDFMSIKQM